MALDWIRLEKVTPDKPEIMRLARMLSISHGEAFLECVRVYIWADGMTEDGHVPCLSLSEGAKLAHCRPKTFEALASKEIRWIVLEGDGFLFVNWDRHNGESAKKRGIEAEKKRKQRQLGKEKGQEMSHKVSPKNRDTCPAEKGTIEKRREEKRREDIPPIVPQGTLDGKSSSFSEHFEEWWKAYPRKEGKQKAFEAWKRAGKRLVASSDKPRSKAEAAAYLLDRVKAYAASPRAKESDPDKIPHPTTWLNGGRYDDDPATWQMVMVVGGGSVGPHQPVEAPYKEY